MLRMRPIVRLYCVLLALGGYGMVQGQTFGQAAPASAAIPGERLSDWLLRNTDGDTDLTALHWRVLTERAAQAALREALLQQLQSALPSNDSQAAPFLAHSTWSPMAHPSLADVLRQLQPTGRIDRKSVV